MQRPTAVPELGSCQPAATTDRAAVPSPAVTSCQRLGSAAGRAPPARWPTPHRAPHALPVVVRTPQPAALGTAAAAVAAAVAAAAGTSMARQPASAWASWAQTAAAAGRRVVSVSAGFVSALVSIAAALSALQLLPQAPTGCRAGAVGSARCRMLQRTQTAVRAGSGASALGRPQPRGRL